MNLAIIHLVLLLKFLKLMKIHKLIFELHAVIKLKILQIMK
jgi:hypothetical protein